MILIIMGNSSQDESRGSQGGAMEIYGNGRIWERDLSLGKRKKQSKNSEDEEGDGYYTTPITEERYRSMLGEHIHKYKRRYKDSSVSPIPPPSKVGIPASKSGLGSSKCRKGNEQRGGLYDVENTSVWLSDVTPQKRRDFVEPDYTPKISYEPAYLDIGEGITYRIPPSYDKFAASLNLPSFSDIRVEEFYLKGTLDLGSLAEMMANDRRFGHRMREGIGEPHPQYESLQTRLKALEGFTSGPKFILKISDAALSSSIPEGAAGSIQRSILSEGGVLQVYYVKVLEKGDTYEIIEPSLPNKPKVKKDPAVIEREEMEKLGKIWVNIVRRDIPKHHRVFTTVHRKQFVDAKRFSEICQREVKMKISRSHKLLKSAPIRTRKLSRDMLLFWKRLDKEMAEVRKREEREAVEALKREQELREARRQQHRLNFLIQQTELYSHFMQNKPSSQSSHTMAVEDAILDSQEMPLSSLAIGPTDVEDPEDVKLREDALKAAQYAVSKQKKLTSDFDSECTKLRQAADLDSSVAGPSDIDLHNPSTMPVTSTVQTPELFKGSLKEY